MEQQNYQHLFDIKKTQLEMVKDRGYEVGEEEAEIFNMNLEQFIVYMNNRAILRKVTPRSALTQDYISADRTRSILAFYGSKTPAQKQVSADIVREFVDLIQKNRVTEAVLIVNAPLSPPGSQILAAVTLTKWQIFNDTDLTYNPTRHVKTPKHELIPPHLQSAKLAELKTTLSGMGLLYDDDPVVRYYGWPKGSMIKITRDNSSISILASKTINYRVVVNRN